MWDKPLNNISSSRYQLLNYMKMKRIINSLLLLQICFWGFLQLAAAPITQQQAQQNVQTFLESKGMATKASTLRLSKPKFTSSNMEYYYVFNIGDNDGYVIAAGDDYAPAILGYADSGSVDVDSMPENMKAWLEEYVSQIEYMQKNPAIPSQDISFDLTKSFAANNAMRYWGAIYRPGGYMYDIYTANRTVSRSIRPNKEFGNDPLNEIDKLPDGMEVLLMGGEPDVVPVGTLANPVGMLFDVWVPNHKRYYKSAMTLLSSGCVPNDIFYFDEDDLIENYAILMKAMHVLDEEANGPEEDESAETTAVPIITDESLDDNDEAPVLIELPEYLA